MQSYSNRHRHFVSKHGTCCAISAGAAAAVCYRPCWPFPAASCCCQHWPWLPAAQDVHSRSDSHQPIIVFPLIPSFESPVPWLVSWPLSQVDSLSSAQEALVTWAVAELQGEGGTCPRQRLQVNNFSSQVRKWRFTLDQMHIILGGCWGPVQVWPGPQPLWRRGLQRVRWDRDLHLSGLGADLEGLQVLLSRFKSLCRVLLFQGGSVGQE